MSTIYSRKRIKSGTPIEEVYKGLTDRQKQLIAQVDFARCHEYDAVRAVIMRSRKRVTQALEAGVPAQVLADRYGLSTARIYQMREEYAAYVAKQSDGIARAVAAISDGPVPEDKPLVSA